MPLDEFGDPVIDGGAAGGRFARAMLLGRRIVAGLDLLFRMRRGRPGSRQGELAAGDGQLAGLAGDAVTKGPRLGAGRLNDEEQSRAATVMKFGPNRHAGALPWLGIRHGDRGQFRSHFHPHFLATPAGKGSEIGQKRCVHQCPAMSKTDVDNNSTNSIAAGISC